MGGRKLALAIVAIVESRKTAKVVPQVTGILERGNL
jgi:hypothetical protein